MGIIQRKADLQYRKVTIERAQIIFRQTLQQACARLNFEQFLYALKLLAQDVYPFTGGSAEVS